MQESGRKKIRKIVYLKHDRNQGRAALQEFVVNTKQPDSNQMAVS
jgi:hypothetical protein